RRLGIRRGRHALEEQGGLSLEKAGDFRRGFLVLNGVANLAEFAQGDVVVTLATTSGTELQMRVSELLPGAFDASFMDNS
ncbi:MAG: hypothetical protein ACPGFC_09055, partial [Paracoccaceae bacterium]